MAKITQVTTDQPSMFEGSNLVATYWCCEECGVLVTPATPAIARWPLGNDTCSGFEVVHKACETGPSQTSWLDLNRLMASLAMHSLGDSAAAASLETIR